MDLRHVTKEHNRFRTLMVEEGQLVCPRAGIVDVERCWICPAFDGMSGGHLEGVVCKANLADLRSDVRPAGR